jgi:hypothetical protein
MCTYFIFKLGQDATLNQKKHYLKKLQMKALGDPPAIIKKLRASPPVLSM